jgi:DNA-binding NarL/FixJ family response regulator
MSRARIIVVDDQPLLLDALEAVLARYEFEVVGKATSSAEAAHIHSREDADVILLDLEIPGEDPVAFTRRVRAAHPRTQVVVMSSAVADDRIRAALSAGAASVVPKSADPADIAGAVARVVGRPRAIEGAPESGARAATRLTARELEVLRLVAEGRSNSEVARRLWITEETVKFHLTKIYRKLRVSNRTEAARRAFASGLLASDDDASPPRWRTTG